MYYPQKSEMCREMEIYGDYRLIQKNGRTGWNGVRMDSYIALHRHNLNEAQGTISIWFMTLEELCTSLRYENFRMNNPFFDNYAIISDNRERGNFHDAVFCINWDCGWYPQLCAKFFKGNIYPTGYAPEPKAIVAAGHCSLNREEWYQLVFSWNKPENRYKLYLNGILIGCSDCYTQGMKWEKAGEVLYLGNPTLCISDVALFKEEIKEEDVQRLFEEECVTKNEALQEELKRTYDDEAVRPFSWTCDSSWETKLSLPLNREEDLKHFYVQGAADSVHITDEGLLIDTPDHLPRHDNKAVDLDQMYLWTNQSFEGDLYVEFEFKSLRKGGLSLLMFQASGMQREDFMREYPLRTNGAMSTVHSEDVRNYHWEFFREMNDTRNDVCSQVVLKNPWFRPLGYHCMKKPLEREVWHTLKLLQRGGRIICVIDDTVMLDMEDNGFGNNGPVLSAGHLAIRCMVRTKMLFRNLKVMNQTAFETVYRSWEGE